MSECKARGANWGDAYPVAVQDDLVTAKPSAEVDAYAFMLVADLGHDYKQLKNAIKADSKSSRLFEKVVEGALRGLFGHAQRFGWPREPAWPTGIDDRIGELAKGLGLQVDSLKDKTDPADNDRTLDVAGLLMLSGGHTAALAILTQCATGANWQDKRGEPSPEAWHNLMHWNCSLARAVALPWRLGSRSGDWTYKRAWQLFNGAMILDRPRLVVGHPDKHLDLAIRHDVRSWWSGAASLLPRA
jgi:hypothetical protein